MQSSVDFFFFLNRLNTALESTMSLELGPRGLLVFEDYAKGKSGNQGKNRQAIPGEPQPRFSFQINTLHFLLT